MVRCHSPLHTFVYNTIDDASILHQVSVYSSRYLWRWKWMEGGPRKMKSGREIASKCGILWGKETWEVSAFLAFSRPNFWCQLTEHFLESLLRSRKCQSHDSKSSLSIFKPKWTRATRWYKATAQTSMDLDRTARY